MASRFGRPPPHPRLGSMVELYRSHLHGSFNLISIGETLPGKGITTEEPPPAFLEVEPTGTLGNEDVLNAWMIHQPGTGFQAVMAAEIVRDNENVPCGVVGFDVLEQFDIVLRIARSRAACDLLA